MSVYIPVLTCQAQAQALTYINQICISNYFQHWVTDKLAILQTIRPYTLSEYCHLNIGSEGVWISCQWRCQWMYWSYEVIMLWRPIYISPSVCPSVPFSDSVPFANVATSNAFAMVVSPRDRRYLTKLWLLALQRSFRRPLSEVAKSILN